MGEMVRCEKLSRESRLRYNGSVDQCFPMSMFGRLFELRKQEPIVTVKDETPIHQILV